MVTKEEFEASARARPKKIEERNKEGKVIFRSEVFDNGADGVLVLDKYNPNGID